MKTQARPWELLGTLPPPSEYDPGVRYFYDNYVKPLIPTVIRVMNTGLNLDQQAIGALQETLDSVLLSVKSRLASNTIIEGFQAQEYPKKFAEYKAEVEKSMRTIDFYRKPYDVKNAVHRTYVMNAYLISIGKEDSVKDKWSAKDVKAFNSYLDSQYIEDLINKKLLPNDKLVIEALYRLAEDKLAIWNKPRLSKIESVDPDTILPPFNPGSSKQLIRLFEFLKVAPLAFSKDTGNASWGRDQVEELLRMSTDESHIDFLEAFIDYSQASVIRQNFIEAFAKFGINGVLRGNIKLYGAKSFRLTSNSPSMLNMPSTGSIFSGPLKECFIAPKGFIIAGSDYGQLEDRVMANLTKDTGKCSIFLKDLDSHCFNALGYFKKELSELLDLTGDIVKDTILFKEMVSKDKRLKAIRQKGKPCTFGISYGSYPPKIAETIKCSLAEATKIFNAYHDDLYPGVTTFREEIILPSAKTNGYVHMGLGARLYTDDVSTDSRTLWNSVSQFWSLLSLISINEIYYQIDKAGYQEDIKVTATIYDSIYFIVRDDPTIIKWLNDTLMPIMVKDWLPDIIVHNTANLDLGTNWNNLVEIPHSCSIEHIQGVLDEQIYKD